MWGTLGTIRPHLNFDAAKDAQTFFEAISGKDFDASGSPANSRGRSRVCKLLVWRPRLKLGGPGLPKGVDCGVLLDLLTSRSSEHRQQIAEAFLEFTQQGLLKTLEAVIPSQFETIIRGLLRPAAQYDAHEIQAGLQGLEVETLIEIISTRTAKQLQDILAYYKQDFKSDLKKDIACGTKGGFRDLLLTLIKLILLKSKLLGPISAWHRLGKECLFCSKVSQLNYFTPSFSAGPAGKLFRDDRLRLDTARFKGETGTSGCLPLWDPSTLGWGGPAAGVPLGAHFQRPPNIWASLPQALADAAAGGDTGHLEESEWVRILAQRSPEHLRRGKDNSVPGGHVSPRWHPQT
ncbi:hypothetical protein L345_03422, partial [Ophiophagus hannah]